jgi:hypothetical protein
MKTIYPILLCVLSFNNGLSQDYIDFNRLLRIERVKRFPYCGKLDLSQNFPNPFKTTQISTINYRAVDVPQASVIIFDMKGGRVLEFAKLSSSVGKVVIEADQLSQGIYTYALFVNNRVVARKKMLIVD